MNTPRRPGPSSAGRLRIVGGVWRSRVLRVPARPGLRPTPDRVRETLFNWLGQDLSGLCCLDLFAGSGALGFEAASRGAARVVMIEHDRIALAALRAHRDALDARVVEIHDVDAQTWLAHEGRHYDVVFLDPPFRQNALPALLAALPARLRQGARVYVESEAAFATGADWHLLREARAGRVHFKLLQRSHHDPGGLPRNI
ncbi:MAG: 16S rRNA (guanine(966)-N(2))-methyltransferase RsmD [Proteobacteria bacterium]|nr:16S rRNA (guanine(966)-N(2))-methyltransferase RsmD [Pseudomonadota bacterium]